MIHQQFLKIKKDVIGDWLDDDEDCKILFTYDNLSGKGLDKFDDDAEKYFKKLNSILIHHYFYNDCNDCFPIFNTHDHGGYVVIKSSKAEYLSVLLKILQKINYCYIYDDIQDIESVNIIDNEKIYYFALETTGG